MLRSYINFTNIINNLQYKVMANQNQTKYVTLQERLNNNPILNEMKEIKWNSDQIKVMKIIEDKLLKKKVFSKFIKIPKKSINRDDLYYVREYGFMNKYHIAKALSVYEDEDGNWLIGLDDNML